MMLQPHPINSRDFAYSKATKTFNVFVSDLGPAFEKRGFERVYDDAADVGLTLESHVTGNRVVFYLHEIHRDQDGDCTHWELRGATKGFRDLKLNIWNT